MKTRFFIAAALLWATCTYTTSTQAFADPQAKSVTSVTGSAHDRFVKDIQAYENAQDKQQATAILERLKKEMMQGIADAKSQVAAAHEEGNDAAYEQALKLNRDRASLYNKLNAATRNPATDKKAIATLLHAYADLK